MADPPVTEEPPSVQPVAPPRPKADDEIDLGATVLPVLVKSYGKQIAGGLVALLALRWLLRRVRGR